MDLSDNRSKVILGVVIVATIGLFYVLWVKSASPEPVLPPGQSISNPMGNRDDTPRGKRQ